LPEKNLSFIVITLYSTLGSSFLRYVEPTLPLGLPQHKAN
jgi:hypothetical protein